MKKLIFLCFLGQALCISLFAQDDNNPRINSGELINQGIQLHNEGKYKEAITLYKKISHSDTNYVRALYEMALSLMSDSNYNEAMHVCEAGLKEPDKEYEPDLLIAYGNAIDDMGDSTRAFRIYDSALQKYPRAQGLLLNKAITLLRMNKTKEAQDVCENLLLRNPFYSSAHYRMAICALRQGRIVPAMMSLFTYLMISPDGPFQGTIIFQLGNISKATDDIMKLVEQRKEEESEYYSLIEQIILSKAALDEKYKLIGSLNDPIVRQLQVMMEKLEYKPEEKDFWMQFYVPLFKSIFEKKQFENAVYNAFSAVEIESIQKYLKNNKKEEKDFAVFVSTYLMKIKSTRVLNYTQRVDAEDLYHMDNDGIFVSKGKILNDEVTGPWEFYYNNGNLKAAGSFNDAGKKNGEWKYYYRYGTQSGIDNWNNGVMDGVDITNNSWGAIIERASYKNGELDGEKINYYAVGHPLTIINYSNGKQNGSSLQFYSSGAKKIEANYLDDKLNGDYKEYYENGRLQTLANYANGEFTGDYKEYYENGQLSLQASYINGKIKGEVKNYFSNGKLQRTRTFTDDEQTGNELNYNDEGILKAKTPYEKGKANGTAEYYDDDGKLYCLFVFKNDALLSAQYLDKTGKEISSAQLKDKSILLNSFSPEGIKISNSTYNDKGLQINSSTLFYTNGKIKETNSFKNGELDGVSTGYHLNGVISAEISYLAGEKDGPYKMYYTNGQLSTTGWYSHGRQIDSWIDYNEKGIVTGRSYYLNGDLYGYKESYYANGKPDDEEIYRGGWLTGLNQYDTNGKLLYSTTFDKGNGHYKELFPGGKIKSEGEYVQGEWHGAFKNYYCDGSLYSVKYFTHGLADSVFIEYHPGGKISTEGRYETGKLAGTWKYYNSEGNITREETYKEGELNGKMISYHHNGKIEKEADYKNGQMNGMYKRYAEDGQLGSVIYYKDDIPVSYTYPDKNGQLLPSIKLEGGNGKILTYYANGNKSTEFEFVEGKINGPFRIYHPNGKLFYEETCEYSITKGRTAEYFSDGSLRLEYNYYWNNADGPYKEYYNNGRVKEEGEYFNGYPNGSRKFYDITGKLTGTDYYYYGNNLSIQK